MIENNQTSTTDIPSEWDLILLNQKLVERKYGLSGFMFVRGLRSGYINNVVAPNYIRQSDTGCQVISKGEMERYVRRVAKFKERYLTYEDIGDLFQWNHHNAETGIRNVRKQMVMDKNYMQIVPPPHYRFILNRRKYFHHVDVELMRVAVIKRARNQLKATPADGFDSSTGLWTPLYLMPSDDLYKDQYKQETRQLLSYWHAHPPSGVLRFPYGA